MGYFAVRPKRSRWRYTKPCSDWRGDTRNPRHNQSPRTICHLLLGPISTPAMSSTETLVTLSKIEYLTRERDEMLNKITELLDERDELRADNESLRRAAGALDELTSKLRQELTETESALAACDAQCERLRADAKDHEAREQLM